MAQKSTIYKAKLEVADLDRHYYGSHQLTLACHPSETTFRMLIRLFVFALNAHKLLEFTKGISTEDEPDLWQKNLTDEIDLWIDLGQPDKKRIGKAAGRATKVILYGYEPRTFEVWWQQHENEVQRFKNLSVYCLSVSDTENLEKMINRTMTLHCTIQENEILVSSENLDLTVSVRQYQ